MKQPKNIAASIRARLLNLARENDEDYNRILLRFVQERLLYRLSQSPHANDFVLKGAALFSLWDGQPHRPTKDTDFLSFGAPNPERLRSVFAEIVGVECADDGLVFDAAAITANPIREHAVYDGIRINIPVRLGTFRTQTQVDVGFGDSIVPEPVEATYPTLLELPAPTIRAYRRETVIAEKFEAIVSLGMTNSRMKDFYDLHVLLPDEKLDREVLRDAITATFARRETPLPKGRPIGLSAAFATDTAHNRQWKAFVSRISTVQGISLGDVIESIWAEIQRLHLVQAVPPA